VRPCFQQDLELVQLIYANHVQTGTGTFEIEPPSLEQMSERWGDIVQRGWPFLVASPTSDLTRIMGFAYAVQYRDRAAYAKTFETSIYCGPTTMRRGVGTQLLGSLLGNLRDDGVHQALAFIGDGYNAASIGLHVKLGYRHVGTLVQVGEKFGRALDVIVMQRNIPAKKAD
jgi:phosphinothricin acetyltransferase